MQIKEELKSSLIFGFAARLPIAMILSYLAYRDVVISKLQKLSHSTRAYIVNAEGLPGFLVLDIIKE